MALGTPSIAPGLSDRLVDRSARTRFRIGFDRAMSWTLPLLFLIAILPIADLVYWVAAKALPTLSWQVLTASPALQSDALSVAIIGTFEVMLLGTLLAVGFGVFGGITTAEILPERTAGFVRTAANLLAGTPSIILGFFGFFAFVLYAGWGAVYLSGTVTLAIFMSPYIFRTVDLAFTSVPRPIREAALGAGASPAQYVLRVALPIAFPQILTGVFLAMAIGVGETAPLVLTTSAGVIAPQGVFSPVTFMTVLVWQNVSQPANSPLIDLAWQAAFLVLVTVIALNIVVRVISARYQKRLEGLYQ